MLGIKIANGVKTTSGKEVDEHDGRTDNAYRQKDVFYLSFCPVIFIIYPLRIGSEANCSFGFQCVT